MSLICSLSGRAAFLVLSLAVTAPVAAITLSQEPEAQAPEPQTDERAAILSILSRGPVGIETDFEAWERNFHPDWTVWFSGQAGVRARGPHMASVRDYIAGGAAVISYDFELDALVVSDETALARFHAIETIREAGGNERRVAYAGTDYLVHEGGRWLIRTSSVSLLEAPVAAER